MICENQVYGWGDIFTAPGLFAARESRILLYPQIDCMM